MHGSRPDICNTVIEVKNGAVIKWGRDQKVTNFVLIQIFEELNLPYLPIEIIDYILSIKIKLIVPQDHSFRLLKIIVETYSEGSGNGKIADWGFAHSIMYKSLYRNSIRSVIKFCKSFNAQKSIEDDN